MTQSYEWVGAIGTILAGGAAVVGLLRKRDARSTNIQTDDHSIRPVGDGNTSTSIQGSVRDVYITPAGSAQPPSPAQMEIQEITPALSLVQTRKIQLIEGAGSWQDGTILSSGPIGICAEFKNVPRSVGERTPAVNLVTASLVFRSSKMPDEQQVHINHAAWLGHYENRVDFAAGITRALILAVPFSVGQETSYVALENHSVVNPFKQRFRHKRTIYSPEKKKIPLQGEIEVTLVSRGVDTVFHEVFDYDFSDGRQIAVQCVNPKLPILKKRKPK